MAQPTDATRLHCPWCSAELPDPGAERCPSCGATLTSGATVEPQLPGVTTLDAEAILRARSEAGRSRSRILSFITGDPIEETGGPASAESLAPPSDAVRREMLRLEAEAERAELEAEVVALQTDELEEAAEAETGDAASAEGASAEPDALDEAADTAREGRTEERRD